MSDLVFGFNANKMVRTFEEDKIFYNIVIKELFTSGEYDDTLIDVINPNRTSLYFELVNLLLANNTFISNNSLIDLWKEQFLLQELCTTVFHVSSVPNIFTEKIYKQIFFTYKYSTINHFFQNNYLIFLPEPEIMAMEGNDKLRVHHMSLMNEFDKFSDIIDSIYDITDVDKVGNEYLPYLIQLVGYEKKEDVFLNNDSFRQLAKNIIEIYRIKGTTYSIELFFNFLGLRMTITECWFDKRLYYSTEQINKITNCSLKTEFGFYITGTKPTDYIPTLEGVPDPLNIGRKRLQVMENELTPIKSSLSFEESVKTIPVLDLLEEYTYFKANLIQYSIASIRAATEEVENFNAEQLAIIDNYLSFLVPIFIRKVFSINAKPIEDVGDIFVLTEDITGAISIQLFYGEKIPEYQDIDFLGTGLLKFSDSTKSSINETNKINEFSYIGVDTNGFSIYLQDEYNFRDSFFDEIYTYTKVMPVNY